MQVVFVKLICNVIYLTIVVMRFNNKSKISKHFINIVQCFFFVLIVIVEIDNVFIFLNVN